MRDLYDLYDLKSKTTISNSPDFPLNWTEEYNKYESLFHPKAKEVFKNVTRNLIYQYNQSEHKYYQMYDVIELLGCLGLKEAESNPLEHTFERKLAIVRYFGFTCRKKDKYQACHKLIGVINDMAASDWLVASLVNLGSLELGINPMFPSINDRVAVFSYVAVKEEYSNIVTDLYRNCEFTEGGIPPEFK